MNCAASVAATNAVIQKQNLILTDDILFSTNLMFLNIVIEDQNDNYPVFTHPPTKNFIVGYPEQKLADKLLPPNLMIVKAFDIDEGLNAKIKYSLNDNRYFAIDSETGVIIPSKECMSNVDEVNLIVTATDRNGALNGNAESFNLKVIKVRIDNLVVMSIEYKQLSDVELFLKNISLNVKMNLLPINYAAIPHYDEEQNGNQWRLDRIVLNLIEIFIKVYVYAFDVENVMELKTNAEIIEMLKVTNITGSYNFTEFTDDLLDCNLTGFIVALSLIGGLLIIVCTVAPLLWFLWLHPKIETQRRSSETSGQQFDEDFNNLPALSSPVMPVKTITLRDEDVMGIEIDGVTIDGTK